MQDGNPKRPWTYIQNPGGNKKKLETVMYSVGDTGLPEPNSPSERYYRVKPVRITLASYPSSPPKSLGTRLGLPSYTVFPQIVCARSINFTAVMLRSQFKGALYSRARFNTDIVCAIASSHSQLQLH